MSVDASELQARLLRMLKQFHNICTENNLRYYVIGGTCIGAKRHKGFIPWDDDIDIGMPRDDYDRLCQLPMEALPSNIELRYYKNTNNSPFHFVKFVDNTTTLIERAYLDYVEGLYIDVFPLDGARNYNESFIERLRCQRIWFEKVLILYHCMTDSRSNVLKKVLIFLSKHISLDKLHNRVEKHITKYSFSNSDFVANYFGAWKEKEIYPKSFLGKPTLYEFEDTYVYGPEKIDDYLKHVYGDYMKLPPKEEQVFKHNYYFINFNIGFHDYKNNEIEKQKDR